MKCRGPVMNIWGGGGEGVVTKFNGYKILIFFSKEGGYMYMYIRSSI